MQEDVFEMIGRIVKSSPVVLFMKGTKNFPQCGFSGRVCHILETLNIDFKDVNILEDEALRQAVKEYSGWPTFPQLYMKGKFSGGCDIISQLHESGDFQKLFD